MNAIATNQLMQKPTIDESELASKKTPSGNGTTTQDNSQEIKKSIRVLLVEDVKILQNIMINLFNELLCTVDLAACGTDALKLFASNQYDLILIDIGLPDISGEEVAKQIRSMEMDQPPIPIIAITAHGLEETQKSCHEAGMNAFMHKPLLYDTAKKIIEKFVCGKPIEIANIVNFSQ